MNARQAIRPFLNAVRQVRTFFFIGSLYPNTQPFVLLDDIEAYVDQNNIKKENCLKRRTRPTSLHLSFLLYSIIIVFQGHHGHAPAPVKFQGPQTPTSFVNDGWATAVSLFASIFTYFLLFVDVRTFFDKLRAKTADA